MKLKKGFTLIELLAVIVVLSILMLVAGTSILGVLEDARKDQFKNEFLDLLNTARIRAQVDMMAGKLTSKNPSECLSFYPDNYSGAAGLDTAKYPFLTEFDDKGKDYVGSVLITLVTKDGNRSIDIKGWMSNDDFKIENGAIDVTRESVVAVESADASIKCGAAS